ncbi:MAG: hypothetical protein ACO1OB_10670 [Archangium sp.]
MRNSLLMLLGLMACGRSELVDEATTGVPDASVVMPAPAVKDPLFVFQLGMCPRTATKDALKPGVDERVFAVEFIAQEECSGAGGDWFIGRELGGVREVAFGDHACWFMPENFRPARVRRFGVVRVNLKPVTMVVPDGWCLETLSGSESVKTDVNVLAFGVYESEADARAAAQALR